MSWKTLSLVVWGEEKAKNQKIEGELSVASDWESCQDDESRVSRRSDRAFYSTGQWPRDISHLQTLAIVELCQCRQLTPVFKAWDSRLKQTTIDWTTGLSIFEKNKSSYFLSPRFRFRQTRRAHIKIHKTGATVCVCVDGVWANRFVSSPVIDKNKECRVEKCRL